MTLVTPNELLKTYTVYCHPRDYPDNYVVREWVIYRGKETPIPSKVLTIKKDYEGICEYRRDYFPDIFVLPRSEGDDISIVETWI